MLQPVKTIFAPRRPTVNAAVLPSDADHFLQSRRRRMIRCNLLALGSYTKEIGYDRETFDPAEDLIPDGV